MNKKVSRIRRAKRTRCKIKELCVDKLSVHRTSRHIYATLVDKENRVITTVSTLSAEIKEAVKSSSNCEAAAAVGKLFSQKAKELGISKVAFDRSGFKYHGRIMALANAAREGGLEF
jgi:large subunit ribosomal protein L18